MNFDDFGEPIPVRKSLKSKIHDNLSHYGKFIVSTVLVLAAIVTILTSLGLIIPFEDDPIEEQFDTKIIGNFIEIPELDLTEFFIPRSIQPTLYIEGVIPNPGWIKITVENFTHHKQYKQDALQLTEVKIYKNIEFSVDRGNFKEEIVLPLSLTWKETSAYPYDSGRETHGPIGNIFFKAEYYDSTKQLSEIFFLQPYLRGGYFSP